MSLCIIFTILNKVFLIGSFIIRSLFQIYWFYFFLFKKILKNKKIFKVKFSISLFKFLLLRSVVLCRNNARKGWGGLPCKGRATHFYVEDVVLPIYRIFFFSRS